MKCLYWKREGRWVVIGYLNIVTRYRLVCVVTEMVTRFSFRDALPPCDGRATTIIQIYFYIFLFIFCWQIKIYFASPSCLSSSVCVPQPQMSRNLNCPLQRRNREWPCGGAVEQGTGEWSCISVFDLWTVKWGMRDVHVEVCRSKEAFIGTM